MQKKANNKGFTLIEIMIVIGLIAILAAIVLIAINPARQFAQGRNAQRESNINVLINAIGQNLADNKGVFTCIGVGTAPDATVREIGTGAVNLSCLTPTYIPSAIPMDPDTTATPADTLYTITASSTGRFTICAPKHAEVAVAGSSVFCITR